MKILIYLLLGPNVLIAIIEFSHDCYKHLNRRQLNNSVIRFNILLANGLSMSTSRHGTLTPLKSPNRSGDFNHANDTNREVKTYRGHKPQ